MELWNYIHYTLGLHFWVIPSAAILLLAVLFLIAHACISRRRRSEHQFSYEMKYGEKKEKGEDE